ncbi:MAG TPA: type I 3-dehydroquinate dehydratase [Vicinamibacterales bacterium]|nr:type I 3-dehydroquinate dehydratase [Vicinamibacterales bacterium]
MALLCETVTGATMRELLAARDAATAGGMVELRLDGNRDLDVAAALHGRQMPAVVTCRASWEGGRFDGSEDERRAILHRALEAGAEFVDVEWRAGFDDVIAHDPSRVVVSFHDFTGTPAGLDDRVAAMRRTGAGTIKVAYAAHRLCDTLPLRAIGEQGQAVVVGMGEPGVPSRLLASRYGSRWTFAGNAVAPGQMPAARMRDVFRFASIGPSTRLFGVVSRTAMHSLSPVMHNAAFAAAGIDAAYVPLSTDDFADFLAYADAMGFEGASVTIPFKLDALRAAAVQTPLAAAVGAANTLRRRRLRQAARSASRESSADLSVRNADRPGEPGPYQWEATNTDVDGFLAPLEPLFPKGLAGVRVAVLGAGGSARAVVAALASRGARVAVHARRIEQAAEVAAAFGASPAALPPAPGSWDLLVNCTPLGGANRRHESPMAGAPIDGRAVYDLTYGDGDSALVADARRAGRVVLDGLPMLIAQAERQFQWWTGQRPEPGIMQAAALNALGRTATTTEATA